VHRGEQSMGEGRVVAPLLFSRVCHGVFRSGFPVEVNFRFLETLGLRHML